MTDELVDIVMNIHQFNQDLTNLNIKQTETIEEQKQEIERLNNIINELEKDLEDKYYGRGKYAMDGDVIGIKEVLTKLQELKGSDNSE